MITDSGFDIWDDLVHGFGGAYLPPIVRTRANRVLPTPTNSSTRTELSSSCNPMSLMARPGSRRAIASRSHATEQNAPSGPTEMIRCA